MNAKEQADFASARGWHPLGNAETEIDTPIDEQEKLSLAEEQSRRLVHARELEGEKKAYDKKKSGEINSELGQAMSLARIISEGVRREVRQLPCFLDHILGLRKYVDPETHITLKTEPMSDADRQLKLA